MKKLLILILPFVLIVLGGCSTTYKDSCEPIAKLECRGYDGYNISMGLDETQTNRSICEINCFTYEHFRFIDIKDMSDY